MEQEEVKVALAQEARLQEVEKTGGRCVGQAKNKIYCLTIIGQVEGHYLLDSTQKSTKYEYVLPQLVAVEQEESIEGLLILLNTVGGDVEAGLAIAELIAGMKKPTVSLVLGGGHSIGVPLAVAAKKSFIVPSASMTVHPVRSNGLVINAPQTYAYFQQMQGRIVRFICDHCKTPPDRLEQLMMKSDEMATDIGSILNGEEAVREGLIDSLGSLCEAMQALNEMIDKKCLTKEGKCGIVDAIRE